MHIKGFHLKLTGVTSVNSLLARTIKFISIQEYLGVLSSLIDNYDEEEKNLKKEGL